MGTSNSAELLKMGKFASKYFWYLEKFNVGKTKKSSCANVSLFFRNDLFVILKQVNFTGS